MRAVRIGTAIYLGVLLAFCVWRAATVPFSVDEAYSYRLYVGAKSFHLFRQYDANLHLLHTWLTWVSVQVFGLSELTMRVPSLLGAALYFTGVWRLCARLAPLSFAAGVVLLTINPLVLDHLVVARGYGLALGFFVWAFAEGTRAARTRVAVWIALSIASNLVFVFPCAALIAAMTIRDGRRVLRDVAAPAFVLAFVAWVLPLSLLEPGQFYFGARDLTEMNQTLTEMSFGGRHIHVWAAHGFALTAFSGAVVLWWRKRSDALVALVSATFVFTVAAVLASHYIAGMPLPYARTGLYLLLLAPLCLVVAGRWAVAPAVVLIAAMASGIQRDRFLEWPLDATSRDVIQAIAADANGKDVRIVTTPTLELTVEIYAAMYGYEWARVERLDQAQGPGDYYVLTDQDRHLVEDLGLRQIYRGRTGVLLAGRP